LKPLKFNSKISRRNTLYGAYIAGITLFFVYALFPSNTVKQVLANRLGQGQPDIAVSIEKASPTLPPGVKLHHLNVLYRNTELFRLEKVKIRPHLLSLFGPRTAMRYTAAGYAGQIRGLAVWDDDPSQGEVSVDGQISGIEVQTIPVLQQLFAHKISGTLDGNFKLTQTGPNRSLTGTLSVSECRVELAAPIFLQKSLAFREINADLIFDDRSLTIKTGTLSGNDLDADVSGTIGLNSGAGSNALDLTGTLTPHHTLLARIEKNLPPNFVQALRAGKNAIPFRIKGTVKNPGFSFN
jgi:type II secretion system protein N